MDNGVTFRFIAADQKAYKYKLQFCGGSENNRWLSVHGNKYSNKKRDNHSAYMHSHTNAGDVWQFHRQDGGGFKIQKSGGAENNRWVAAHNCNNSGDVRE